VSPLEGVVDRRTYVVEGMTCDHCVHAVRTEVGAIDGVDRVDVDLATKLVTVHGTGLDDAAVRVAVDEAGYEAVPVEGRG
jgi:copper chaperone CopZ